MKKILLSLIAIATITFSVDAQTKRNNAEKQNRTEKNGKSKLGHAKHDEKKHDQMMNHHKMGDKVNLTEAQRQQMKSINMDFKNRLQELKKSDNMTVKEFNAKKEALMQERKQKIQALLTPEQKNQMKQFKKEHSDKGEIESGKRMEKMQTNLGLSNDQVAKMKAQKEIYKSRTEAIKNNQSTGNERKKEQLKALREERKNSFKSFLTPEQLQKLEAMKNKRSMKTS
jgi:Spy/CpxP family protein refolding chaperone